MPTYRDKSHESARRPIVLHAKVDVQCDKITTVVGRTTLTTLAAVDVLRQKSRFRDKVPYRSKQPCFGDT